MTLGEYIINIKNLIFLCLDTRKCQDCLQHYLNELCVAFGKKGWCKTSLVASILIYFF